MTPDPDWKTHAKEIVPGVIGALVALRWLDGSSWQLAASFVGGSGAAYYAAPPLADWLSVSLGLCGFLTGLFGMALASRAFEGISAIPIKRVIDNFLQRWGL